jgi:hypothetical protein
MQIDIDAPALEGLGDPVAARLDGIGCLALRLNWVSDPVARDLIIEAIANATDSIAPKRDEKQGFNRLRSYQDNNSQ